jgi:hypothetical protein
MATQTIDDQQAGNLNEAALAEYAKLFNIEVSQVLDHLLAATAFGATSTSIGAAYWGFNHRNTSTPIPINRDGAGLVFFTRPDMNMASSNLRHHRPMNALQTDASQSMPRIFRNYLDPDLAKPGNPSPAITCPFVDNLQAFIPLLTNTCISMSGFEDMEAPLAATKAGAYGESMNFVDGISDKLGVYDITSTFRNMVGDPVTMLIYYWIKYMTAVRQGLMIPRFNNIFENRVDYQTRIYRLSLDHSRTYVQKIACTGASVPKFTPIGAAMNFEADKPFNASNDQVSITWSGHGLYYMDDFIIRSFNSTVKLFNPAMADDRRDKEYMKIPYDALQLFNNKGYPYILTETMELSWWVSVNDYNLVLAGTRPTASRIR